MKVIVKGNLKHDGREYAPGGDPQEVKDLTKAEAATLVSAGVIEIPAKEAPKDPPPPPPPAGDKQPEKPTDAEKGEAAGDGKPDEGGQ